MILICAITPETNHQEQREDVEEGGERHSFHHTSLVFLAKCISSVNFAYESNIDDELLHDLATLCIDQCHQWIRDLPTCERGIGR